MTWPALPDLPADRKAARRARALIDGGAEQEILRIQADQPWRTADEIGEALHDIAVNGNTR